MMMDIEENYDQFVYSKTVATMASAYQKLKSMSKDELIKAYDEKAPYSAIGLDFLREELARREFEEQNKLIIVMTHQMRNLTIFITVLTLINVILVAYTIWTG